MPVNAAPRGQVFDVQRFSVHDGPGIRTTVFLAGCSLRCAWCHNPEAFAGASATVREVDEVLAEVLLDRAFYAATGGGLTVSGGEPLLQPAFVEALLGRAKAEGLNTCVQTAGAVPFAALREVLAVTDLFQFDLKHFDPARHRALTGGALEPILANAARLVGAGARVEFRVPLVPGFNDAPGNLDAVAEFLESIGARAVRLVPYQGLYLDKYRRLGLEARCAAVEAPTREALLAAAQRLGGRGATVAVVG